MCVCVHKYLSKHDFGPDSDMFYMCRRLCVAHVNWRRSLPQYHDVMTRVSRVVRTLFAHVDHNINMPSVRSLSLLSSTNDLPRRVRDTDEYMYEMMYLDNLE